MKKILLVCLALITCLTGFAQNIPNGNFELALTNGWNATGSGVSTTTSVPSLKGQTKALTLTTYSTTVATAAAVVSSSADHLGSIAATTPVGSFTVSVASVDYRPKTLTGFVKYVPAGTDLAEISVTLFKAGGIIGGITSYTIAATPTTTLAAGFVSINVPLTYTNTTDLPDSIQILMKSSQNPSASNVGSKLSVDNLRFLSCTPDPSITLTSSATRSPATSVLEYRLNTDSRVYNTQVFTKAIRNPSYIAFGATTLTINPLDSVIWDPIAFPANSTLTYIPGHPSGVSYGNSVYCYTVMGNLPSANDTAFVLANKNTAYGKAYYPALNLGGTPIPAGSLTLPATTPTNTSHQPSDSITIVFGIPDSLATVKTTKASAITSTSAISGGNVTNDGHDPNTTRGVCYSTVTGPTYTNSAVAGGTGVGTFTVTLSGLMPDSTYYIRAYTTNKIGTSYGNQDTIKALSLGINTVSLKNNIEVYPNPSSGVFTIQMVNGEITNSILNVYNSFGESVFKTNVKQLASSSIDLSALPKGVYLLEIKSGSTIILNKKIIII